MKSLPTMYAERTRIDVYVNGLTTNGFGLHSVDIWGCLHEYTYTPKQVLIFEHLLNSVP